MESPIPAGRTLTREEEIAILRQRLRKSQSIFVRVKAADALSLRGDKESVPDIAALMPRADSIEDQATLCQALAHLGAREYGPAAVEWLRRLIAEDRACAACFRCVLGYGVAGAADILIDSATRGTPQNRRQALAALGGFMFAPSYNQPRVAALYDSDPDVRQTGCESLVQAQRLTRDRALPDALTRPPACEIMRNRDWRPTADALRAMAEGPSTVKR